jgi:hypothetical protein
LGGSTLTKANLSGALVTGANFSITTEYGFTKQQLYSTDSYQTKNLAGIDLAYNDLTGWDFSGQNLASAKLANSKLTNANLSGAILKNAGLTDAIDLQSAVFDPNTVYNQWTAFPAGFDPVAKGLTRMPSPVGDFDANDKLDVADIDMLQSRIRWYRFDRTFPQTQSWLPDAMFDLDSIHNVTQDDLAVWVKDVKRTWFGDANLDGEFNSTDLVAVFQSGQYEDEMNLNSSWSTGDWDTDGQFNSSDLVVAFQDGGYEVGRRTGVAAVPEPSGITLLVLACCSFLWIRTIRPSPYCVGGDGVISAVEPSKL